MSRRILYSFLLLLCAARSHAAQANATIDDADASIIYAPQGVWNSSRIVCASAACDNPPILLAQGGTWHKGLHVLPPDADDQPPAPSTTPKPPPPDDDDPNTPPGTPDNDNDPDDKPPPKPSASSSASSASQQDDDDPKTTAGTPDKDSDADDHVVTKASPTTSAKKPPKPSSTPSDDGKGKGKGDDDDDSDSDSKGGKDIDRRRRRFDIDRRAIPRLDTDDTGFVDTPVVARFNFTGTAVYVFSILPVSAPSWASSPALVNVTFALDSAPAGTFVHKPSGISSNATFTAGANVFARSGITDGPHSFSITLAPNSVFVLDYVLVTQDVQAASTAAGTVASPSSSSTAPPSDDKKGMASFIGALTGSMGVLGILSFGTAFSLIRRRRRAARRDRLRPPPPMLGPNGVITGFVPRYFPGTVVPPELPPYSPSTSSPTHSQALLSPDTEEASYADIPPPIDEFAPPPFGEAVRAPVFRIATGGIAHIGPAGVVSTPLRPQPHMVALPPSRAASRPASRAASTRAPSLFAAQDDEV